MQDVFLYTAIVGGAFLVLQTILTLFGSDHHDVTDLDTSGVDLDHPGEAHLDAHDGFLTLLSLKGIVAFLTFFGLGGAISSQSGLDALPATAIGLGAGTAAMYGVAWMMAGLARLQSSGNVDLRRAIGQRGQVYVRVPEGRRGEGKVFVIVTGKKLECRAITAGPELTPGTEIEVTAMAASDTLEVVACA